MTIQIEEPDEPRPKRDAWTAHNFGSHITYIWDWDKVVDAYHRAIKRQLEEQTAFRSLDEPRDN